MFNLGYKEIVLNSDASIDITGDVLSIEGYGTFNKTDAAFVAQHSFNVAVDPVQEIAIYVIPATSIVMPPDAWGNAQTLAVGNAIEVEVKVRSLRNMSALARDFIIDGKSIVFQSTPLLAVDAAGIATAIAAGYKLLFDKLSESERYFEIVANGDNIELTVTKGLEHVYVKSLGLKVVAHGGLPFTMVAKDASSTEGVIGLGQGKFIEESRRMATFENIAPYAQQHGGNSQGVDVRGKYTQYLFESSKDSTAPGWESHEYVDHSFVNAEMNSTPRKYVMYINENVDQTTLAAFFA